MENQQFKQGDKVVLIHNSSAVFLVVRVESKIVQDQPVVVIDTNGDTKRIPSFALRHMEEENSDISLPFYAG